MDRIIEVKVFGNHLTKDSKNAGTKGEANVARLRITFDESWDYYEKEAIFWDAYGENPVKRLITTDLYEDATKSTRVYLVPIPAEAMARAGLLTFIIKGYLDGKKQVSITSKLEVKDSPDILEPIDPTPTQAAQLQVQIEAIKDDIQGVAIARDETAESAKASAESARESQMSAETAGYYSSVAVASVGKVSYIGENGNWYAWDGEKAEFYDTGVKAQAGSTVYYGDNPPEEADVWVDPNGVVDAYTRGEVDNLIAEINTQMDTLDDEKADKSTTLAGYGITDAYDKKTVDDSLLAYASSLGSLSAKKADKATTLEGYGITDAYTKEEADGKFQNQLTAQQLQNISDVTSKVDKVDGKGLSTEDYTTEDKNKVKEVDSKADLNYVKESFANALKGTASGESIGLNDISPIEHTMAVKVRSENLNVDVTSVKVIELGGNLLDINDVTERTAAGLTVTKTGDGGFNVVGTSTTSSLAVTRNGISNISVLPAGTYTVAGYDKLEVSITDADGKKSYRRGTFTINAPHTLNDLVVSGLSAGEGCNLTIYPALVVGDVGYYEPYKEPITHTINADGTVGDVTAFCPNTTLLPNTSGIVLDVEYNRDINKAFAELQALLTGTINTLGGDA